MTLNETQRRLANAFAQYVVTLPDGRHCYVFDLKRFDELVRAAWMARGDEDVESQTTNRQPTNAGVSR